MTPPTIAAHLTVLALLISATAAATVYTNYTVGGAAGWFFNATANNSVTNYSAWAATQTFNLGDFLSKPCPFPFDLFLLRTFHFGYSVDLSAKFLFGSCENEGKFKLVNNSKGSKSFSHSWIKIFKPDHIIPPLSGRTKRINSFFIFLF